jgi:UDP-N-acetylmuramate--alanine ligase
MKFEHIDRVYFVGIGGIGMSGLARYFNAIGKEVAGYDKTRTTLCETLELEGISISYDEQLEAVPTKFLEASKTLVVYTPAVPTQHIQLSYFIANGFAVKKRAEVLGIITSENTTLAVAGTHGKTTTSSILAHLLKSAGENINAFLGGIALNYNSNVLLGDASTVVVEADEFDRSFLHLKPNISVITNTDADHLDIYGDGASFIKGFEDFGSICREKGQLICQKNVALPSDYSYGLDNTSDFYAHNIKVVNGAFRFSLQLLDKGAQNVALALPGRHNIENAVAASAIAFLHGLEIAQIVKGLESFKGVYRRFQYHLNTTEKVYIDDYAHHPSEIKATISSVKELFPHRHITVIFQPHLFSRTRDFMGDFAESLSLADEVIVLPIYPARERPIAGVNSEALAALVQKAHCSVVHGSGLVESLKAKQLDVCLTLGAGDIDRLVAPIYQTIKNQGYDA